MVTAIWRVDDVLRERRWSATTANPWRSAATLLAMIFVFGPLYGAVMGSFGGWNSDRIPQVVYSAVKVPILLLATFAISLPSFYVLNVLLGVGRDFRRALRAVVAAQAVVSIVLASLAPYTALWYLSFRGYSESIFLNAIVFGVASLVGQFALRRAYRPLIASNSKHRWLLYGWIAIYALVGIQMGWTLRPFIGAPGVVPQFFRSEQLTNAYVVVAKLIWNVLFGG